MGLNSGYSLEQIGSALGHISTATTRRYSNLKSDSATEVPSHMFDRFVNYSIDNLYLLTINNILL